MTMDNNLRWKSSNIGKKIPSVKMPIKGKNPQSALSCLLFYIYCICVTVGKMLKPLSVEGFVGSQHEGNSLFPCGIAERIYPVASDTHHNAFAVQISDGCNRPIRYRIFVGKDSRVGHTGIQGGCGGSQGVREHHADLLARNGQAGRETVRGDALCDSQIIGLENLRIAGVCEGIWGGL